MRKSLVLIACLFAFASSVVGQTNVSGTISSNTTWDTTNAPYIVTGNVTVAAGITLTIDSSVIVRIQSNQGIFVRGTLNARHTTFTSSRDTTLGSPGKGDWNYIQVGDASASGIAAMDTCTVKFGGSSSFPSNVGMVFVYSGAASFTGTDIASSKNIGVEINGGTTVTFKNTNIFSCDWPAMYNGTASVVFNGSNNLTGNTHIGIYMNFTTMSSTLLLDTVAVPYVFLNNFTVTSSASLVVPSTAMLKFGSGDHLYIDGVLDANAGTSEEIFFTAYTDDNVGGDSNGDVTATAPASSYWGGVVFNDPSNDALCIMRRCKVTFAGYGQRGGITMYNAGPTIDSCDMANNYYGVMLQYVSNPVFSSNTLGSSEMVPIAMSFAANPTFTNNTLSFSDNEYDAIGLLGGVLVANAYLPIRSVTSIPNITYLLLESVTVPAGDTLQIQKGIVIKAYTHSHRITVKGMLIADGDAMDKIVFTSSKDDVFGNPGDTNKDGTQSSPGITDWSGIVFEATSDTNSIIDHCIIKYASLYSTYYNTRYISGGAVTTVNARPSISNSEIKDVICGIYAFQASNPKIWNNSITNTASTPIALSVSADPGFVGNVFTNTGLIALGIIGENVGFNGTVKQRNVAGYTNITYVLLEDLTVNSGTNVDIEPGVVIKSNPNTGIYSDGGFRAVGTPATGGRIVFTSLKDDNFGNPFDTNGDGAATAPQKGDWSGIRFQSTSSDAYCRLERCDIRFPGAGGLMYPTRAGVVFQDAGGSLITCLITDSYNYGVACEGSSAPLVDGVDILNCTYDPIAMSLKSDPSFSNITFAANGSKGIKILEGTLSSDATLARRDVAGIQNIAYIVDNLTISPNATLTIAPGVVIKMRYYYNAISVDGALHAEGTATERVVFTSFKDDSNGGDTNNDGNTSTPVPGDWYSIAINSSAIDTVNMFRHCEFRYGGSGYLNSNYKQYGMIRITNAKMVVDSCYVQQSATCGLGIFGSATPDVSNCEITNMEYTPVIISMFAGPTFSNIASSNVGLMAIGIVPETYSVDGAFPVRDLGGYSNITYYVFSTCTINSGTTITVPPGMVFKGTSYTTYFTVNGALIVQGTNSQPVVMTDYRDDSYGNPFDTNNDGSATQPSISSVSRLVFNDVSNDALSSVQHTIFRYCRYGIDLTSASPEINGCLFDRSTWGVRLDGVSQPTLDSCEFRNMTYCGLITSLVSYPSSTVGNMFSGTTHHAVGILDETLVQDVTLPKRDFAGITNIPYALGAYTVGTGAILTIDPGVVLKFYAGGDLTVRKGLIAEGGATPDSLIVFTDMSDDYYGGDTNQDTTYSTPGSSVTSWEGITFANESLDPLCRLRYCVVKDANYYTTNSAGVTTVSASPTITNSVFTKNYIGVRADAASNPVITYCDIYDNNHRGVQNTNLSFNINALYNWWGDDSGPTHASNPGGKGDAITDSVRYSPFISHAQLPKAGDVSLNGDVRAYDATLVLQFVADPVTYPLDATQQMVADVSGTAGITSFDASLILQYVVGNILYFPVEGTNNQPGVLPKLLATRVEIGKLTVERGAFIQIPIRVHGGRHVASADIGLEYDSNVLTFRDADLASSARDMVMVKHAGDGTIILAVAGSRYVDIDGDFITLSFDVSPDLRGVVEAPLSFTRLLLNETDMLSGANAGGLKITGKPTEFVLLQNYPNPFNPITTIRFQIPEDATEVSVTIYNMVGEVVRTLVNERRDAGTYDVQWDGRNEGGTIVGSGAYFFRLVATGKQPYSAVRKMLFVK